MVSPGIEPGTLCVLGICDNQLHHETRCHVIAQVPSRDHPYPICIHSSWKFHGNGYKIHMNFTNFISIFPLSQYSVISRPWAFLLGLCSDTAPSTRPKMEEIPGSRWVSFPSQPLMEKSVRK